MGDVVIQLDEQKTAYRPGEMIRGSVAWSLEERPQSVEVRLVWSTAGKGDRNFQVVQTVSPRATQIRDQQMFQLQAPQGPYSFSGKLVSLVWAVEAVVEPKSLSTRSEIVISPTGQEINL